MKQACDTETLSAYVDGEIDLDTVSRIESQLDKDPEARGYVIDAVKAAARLRATLNQVLNETIPERLLNAAAVRGSAGGRKAVWRSPVIRIAATVFLVMVGFGSGVFFDRNRQETAPGFVPAIPEQCSQVVNKALEYDLSGTVRKWQAPNVSLTVLVTPVRTYRDPRGTYFREYRLEVVTEAETNQIRGLAYRDAQGIWKTKALIF